MKCDDCKGTGDGVKMPNGRMGKCSICSGTGYRCDVCGESSESGCDICDDCAAENADD